MRKIDDHFGVESWVDFVRGQATRELAAPMQEHLNRNCDSCAREAELWQKVSTLARREQESEPPFADVRCAKALYSGFRTRNVRPFQLRFARLIGLNRPAIVGVRSLGAAPSHYLLQEGNVLLDLHLEPRPAFGSMSMAGQIFDPANSAAQYAGRPVAVQRAEEIVAQTTSNEFGEFQLQFFVQPDLLLSVELEENSYLLSWLRDVTQE